jgi:hypothetical protein
MKGVLPWLVLWPFQAGTRAFCSAMATLLGPVQHLVFLTLHYLVNLSPSLAGHWQAIVPGRLSLNNMCLWL